MEGADKDTCPPLPPTWPQCKEPYRTHLAELAAAWLAGDLSHERLALELIQQSALARHVSQPAPGLRKIPMEDVLSQIAVLTDSLLAAIQLEKETLPALRQEALNFNRSRKRSKDQPELPSP